jgi:hypothetical protein
LIAPLLTGRAAADHAAAIDEIFSKIAGAQAIFLIKRLSSPVPSGHACSMSRLNVARLHIAKIGVKLTELRKDQADYMGVKTEGPFKAEHSRYRACAITNSCYARPSRRAQLFLRSEFGRSGLPIIAVVGHSPSKTGAPPCVPGHPG